MTAVVREKISSPVLVLIGPTAIGKTALSLELAELFNCEIVSVDSMQVYRFMDIGTAKPSAGERERIPHHLIDIVDPDEQYNSARFTGDALDAISRITADGKIPLLTGGTGLYLKALTEGLFDHETGNESLRERLAERLRREGRGTLVDELRRVDPESAARIHANDTQRLLRALEIYEATGLPWSDHIRQQVKPPILFTDMLQIGLSCDRDELYRRIEERTEKMFSAGLIEETERLIGRGYHPSLPAMQAIGYRHACNYLSGVWSREETCRLLVRDTRRYAKRQLTWFTRNEAIEWFDREDSRGVLDRVRNWHAAGTGGRH